MVAGTALDTSMLGNSELGFTCQEVQFIWRTSWQTARTELSRLYKHKAPRLRGFLFQLFYNDFTKTYIPI